MNAVEIEEAISNMVEQNFNSAEFPFAFLEAYGNKPPTIKRLKAGTVGDSYYNREKATLSSSNTLRGKD